MWTLLGTVVSGFLLLRDIFGYLLPGALFLGIAGSSMWLRFPGKLPWLLLHHSELAPFWFFVALLLLLSYLLGQILVSIGFVILDAVGLIASAVHGKHEKSSAAPSMTDEIYYGYLYPGMFTEANRRGTINILRIGLAVSLTGGALLLYPQSRSAFWIALIIGIYMLYNSRTGMAHVAGVRADTIEAAKRAAQNGIPPFNWSTGPRDGTSGSEEESEQKAESRATAQKAGKG